MPYQDIIASFQQQQEAARAANEARYAEALELYDKIIETYQPEGGFLTGAKAELEREKGRTVAGQEQRLVSSGLFGTSVTAGLGQKWESEVGMPARLKLEDVRMGRLAEALQSKAGAIERREDVGPDYATIAALSQGAASRPMVGAYQAPQYRQPEQSLADWQRENFPMNPWGRRAPTPSAPARRGGVGAGTGLGTPTTGAQQPYTPMSDADMQALLARQPGGQVSQDIFGAMSGFATQAAGAVGAGGTTGATTMGQKSTAAAWEAHFKKEVKAGELSQSGYQYSMSKMPQYLKMGMPPS